MMMLSRKKHSEKSVKYTPCGKGENTDSEHELETIAVVSKENGPDDTQTANGPNTIPGPLLYQSPSDRTKLIGERLSGNKSGSMADSSPIYSGKPSLEQKSSRTSSRQSLFDVMATSFNRVKRKSTKEEVSFLNRSFRSRSNEIITPKAIRKIRRKEIEERFGKKSMKYEKIEGLSTASSDKDGCKWTFIFDPSGRLCHWWSMVVSLAFLYNFWVPIYRFGFAEIDTENLAHWFSMDYTADLIYVLDIAVHFRTGYLEEGVLQTDGTKLRIHYMNSTTFYIDCLCLLPLDFLYLSVGFNSLFRGFRLVKIYRFWAFLDRTERHTNYPNAVRTCTLLHYLFAIFHWNACLYVIIASKIDQNPTFWDLPSNSTTYGTAEDYLSALYYSTLMLTTTGSLKEKPSHSGQYFFLIVQMIVALLLFASVLGHVANIVSNISAARKEFQAKLDSVKTYMSLRRVPLKLQDRVIKWFDYLWMCNKSADEDKTLSLLPDKLKAEIAIHVHLDTLKRVEIFQNTEAGFLCELVLSLRPVLFSPGDYICRKGEVGKEMYIVNRGRLQVVADDGKTVLATLKPGSYFGEISILNMGTAGNRRTASVRSVGYSDLFCLSKTDLWDVLKDYPAARVRLEAIAVKRLEKYKKAPLSQSESSLNRSKSTPGLVESSGRVPLKTMLIPRHHTLPVGLPTNPTTNSTNSLHSNSDNNTINNNDGKHELSCPEEVKEVMRMRNSPSSAELNNFNGAAMTVMPHSSSVLPLTHAHHQPLHLSHSLPPSPIRNAMPSNIVISPATTPCGTPFAQTPDSTTQLLNPSDYGQSPATTRRGKRPSASAPASPNYMTNQSFQLTTNFLAPQGGTAMSSQLVPHPPTMLVPVNSLASSTSGMGESNQDALLQEITRLRERVASLESENSSLNVKLNQQQWEVESRLAEIEMQIQGAGSASDSTVGSTVGEISIDHQSKESVI